MTVRDGTNPEAGGGDIIYIMKPLQEMIFCKPGLGWVKGPGVARRPVKNM
jgi:hypothetical protein